MDQAASAFLALAESTSGDDAAHYRLRAAEAMREAGDLDGAARVLGDVKRRRLHGSEQVRFDLLEAEIALKHGDAAQAQALLATLDGYVAAATCAHARSSFARAPKSPGAIAMRPRARAQSSIAISKAPTATRTARKSSIRSARSTPAR